MLEKAKSNHNLIKVMQALSKPQLLIIDELGFIPFSENGARLLFDVFASLYERGSIAVSNQPIVRQMDTGIWQSRANSSACGSLYT